MRKLVLFMHTSLDGYVAGVNGEMDWIKVDDEMFDYAAERTQESDTALYGRVTWQMMDDYWPTAADKPGASKHDIEHSTWYNKVQKVVVSRTLKKVPEKTTVINENIEVSIQKIKHQPGKDIIMFGSPTLAHSLTKANLVDEYWLFVNPILVGEGIPLFTNAGKAKLELLKSDAFSSDVICLHYKVATK